MGTVVSLATTPRTEEPFAVRELRLPVELASVRHARRWGRDKALAYGAGDLDAGVVELLISEVVSNAVIHAAAGTEAVVLRLIDEPRGLRVEVDDGGRGEPRRVFRPMGEGGLGLRLLADLAAAWGVHRWPGGKTVWFTVELRTETAPRE